MHQPVDRADRIRWEYRQLAYDYNADYYDDGEMVHVMGAHGKNIWGQGCYYADQVFYCSDKGGSFMEWVEEGDYAPAC